ncbi:MAG TPA: hypothetical protein VKH19_03575 [Gemmatimonadaceae bacterium]|nr:hypothetical protein [Gemmatimonadaceae bacterium]
MPPPAGSSRTPSDAALAALPPELASKSVSTSRILMPKAAVVEALDILASRDFVLENWEAWMQLPNGGRVKSLSHAGSFALPRDAKRAAEKARAGIEAAQARWNRDPEYPNAVLHFALTYAAT